MNQHAKNMRLVGKMHQHLIITPRSGCSKLRHWRYSLPVSISRSPCVGTAEVPSTTHLRSPRKQQENLENIMITIELITFFWMDFWLAKDSTWLNYHTSAIPNATSWLTNRKKSVQSEHIISPTKKYTFLLWRESCLDSRCSSDPNRRLVDHWPTAP